MNNDLFKRVSEQEFAKMKAAEDEELKKAEKEFDKKVNKKYILLLISNEDEDDKTWKEFLGRDSLVEYIKQIVEDVDIKHSLVLTENVSIKDAINIYEFMKYMYETKGYYNDGFDIEDYN